MSTNKTTQFKMVLCASATALSVVLGGNILVAKGQRDESKIPQPMTSLAAETGHKTTGRLKENIQASNPVSGVSLKVTSARKFVLPSHAVILDIEVANKGQETVFSDSGLPEQDFRVVAKDRQQAKIMPLTRYGVFMREPGRYRNGLLELKPGQSRKSKLMVNRVVDMTVSGRYQISVSRSFRIKGKMVRVESDTVEVNVDETALSQTDGQGDS